MPEQRPGAIMLLASEHHFLMWIIAQASRASEYPFGISDALVGVPPSPGPGAERPVEHALRRGFPAPVGRSFPHIRAGIPLPGYDSFANRMGQ